MKKKEIVRMAVSSIIIIIIIIIISMAAPPDPARSDPYFLAYSLHTISIQRPYPASSDRRPNIRDMFILITITTSMSAP